MGAKQFSGYIDLSLSSNFNNLLQIEVPQVIKKKLMTQISSNNNQDLTLRAYQSEVISQVYEKFNSGKISILLYAPTGAGKTIIAAKIIADWVKQGKRVLFLVHRGKLVHQTKEKLSTHFGIEPSVIWRDFYQPDYSNSVQIAMLQTLQNRELPADIDLVILDEAHTGSYYKIWQKIMVYYSAGVVALSKTKFLGLSASPWRSKTDQGYCQFFQTVIRAPNPKELIQMGHLCRARQFGYTGLIDESKLRVVDGEFTEDSMRSVCTPALNHEIIKIYLQRDSCLERKLIAFCANVEQAVNLAEQFCSVGIRAECIIGETREEERDRIFEEYREGKIQLISSVGVLCEGFDEPSVSSVLVCRPVKSKALWVQMNGRGLRPFVGKEDCWFLDFCGNIKRLGLPTDTGAIDLCPGNKQTEPIPTKECPKCDSSIAIYEKICPHCGFVFDSQKKVAKATKRKFEEILSLEQQQQFRFLKVRAVNAYNKCKPINNLDNLFVREFNYNPPTDWYDGLIFNNDLDTWEIHVQHYWRYLLEIIPNPGSSTAKEKIQELIKREFKSAIQHTKEYFQKSFIQTNQGGIDYLTVWLKSSAGGSSSQLIMLF
jgi:superfamily II DNA or RNA helicase